MLEKLITNDKFCETMSDNARDFMVFLLDNGIEFAVICHTRDIVFEPQLPSKIKKQIKQVALFALSNYSFESAYLGDDGRTLYFEAGFGADNFASLVSIELMDIAQIIVEETPVYLNICAGREKPKKNKKPFDAASYTTERSMEKLLGRPENQRFLK